MTNSVYLLNQINYNKSWKQSNKVKYKSDKGYTSLTEYLVNSGRLWSINVYKQIFYALNDFF